MATAKLKPDPARTTIEDMVQREVVCCLSSLVSTIAKLAGYPLSAQYVSRETMADVNGLAEQAFELASPVLDYEEAALQEGWKFRSAGTPNSYDAPKSSGRGLIIRYDNWEDLCRQNNIEPYEWEVYEFWAVSEWLAGKLIALGQKVDTDFAGLNVWARTTTGQAISMDGCIQRIYADMMK